MISEKSGEDRNNLNKEEMKKFGVLLVLGLILSVSASAQYKVNKQKYNYKDYESQQGDPYNPIVLGGASLLLPGLGQIMADEVLRGSYFILGAVGGCVLLYNGTKKYIDSGLVLGGEEALQGLGTMMIGAAIFLTVQIWAMIDAMRVAKVNSMALRDQASNFKILPYLGNVSNSDKLVAGLTLQIQLD